MLVHRFERSTHPSRIVLLGSNGFLASELRRTFDSARMAYRAVGSKEVDLIEGSSTDQLAQILQSQDALVITSALTPEKGRDPATLIKNLRMVEHVTLVLGRQPCAQVVYVSSDGVYSARSSLIAEDSPCETADIYAVAHVVREKILLQACQKAEIPLAIVRPSAIYGSGDTHNSYGPNRFARAALKDGKIVLFGCGEERRDHVHVKDVASLIQRCLEHRSAGVLNAVTGQAWSFRAIAEKITGVLGYPIAIQELPRTGPITHRHFDITARLRAFPDFQTTSIESGLAETVAGMRDVKAGPS
jgi:nucleoside-diphosphate-sugar epimerase